MLKVPYFIIFLTLSTAAVVINSTTTIDIQITNTINILNNSNTDECSKLAVGTTKLFHLSLETNFQMWDLTNLTQPPINSTTWIHDCNAGMNNLFLQTNHLYIMTICSSISGYFKYQYNGSNPIIQAPAQYSYPVSPTAVFMNAGNVYQFFPSNTSTDLLKLRVLGTVTDYSLHSQNGRVNMSPDKSILIAWDRSGKIYFYNTSSFTLLHTFNQTNFGIVLLTEKIHFNSDATLIAIESDGYNSLIIFNLTSYSIIKNITVLGIILDVVFLDKDNNFLYVRESTSNYILDMYSGTMFPQNFINNSTVRVSNTNNRIYTCQNNQINEYSFGVSQNDTFITPGNSSSSNIDESKFYYKINQNQISSTLTLGLKNSLQTLMKFTSQAINFSASTPFTIYLLTFINYFSLTSLYVLLNFPIPEKVYKCLSYNYLMLNQNFFQLVGLNIKIPKIISEQLTGDKPLFFNISSDFISNNTVSIIILFGNLTLLFLWLLFCNKYMVKESLIRRLTNKNKYEIVFGQIICFGQPVFLPLSYLLFFSGQRNFCSKMNFLLNSIFAFIVLISSFLYIINLIDRRKKDLKELEKHQSQRLNQNKMIEDKSKQEKDKKRTKTMKKSSLITVEIFQDWLTYINNIFYPFLVILQNPIYFLFAILFLSAVDVIIVLKVVNMQKNKLFLKFYPFIFHLCFIIFYHYQNTTILIIAQIVCLMTLLIGSVHNILTFLVTAIYQFTKLIKKCINLSKVTQNPIIHKKKQQLFKSKTKLTTIQKVKYNTRTCLKKQKNVIQAKPFPTIKKNPIKKCIEEKKKELIIHFAPISIGKNTYQFQEIRFK